MWQTPLNQPTNAVSRVPTNPGLHQLLRQRGHKFFLAADTPLADGAVFLKADRIRAKFHLLQFLRGLISRIHQRPLTTRTRRITPLPNPVQLVFLEPRSHMSWMARLPTDPPLLGPPRLVAFGLRLDDVAGRRLGRVRRILPGFCQFGFQLRNPAPLLLQLPLQPCAVRTSGPQSFYHDGRNLPQAGKITNINPKPVNGYPFAMRVGVLFVKAEPVKHG